MTKAYRYLALLLTFLLLLPWTIGIVQAETILEGPIQTEDYNLLITLLERKAINYISKYIDIAYLYLDNDLTENTVVDYYSEADINAFKSNNATLLVNGEEKTIVDLYENILHFEDVANFLKYIRNTANIVRCNFECNVDAVETTLSDSSAVVQVYSAITFRYDTCDEDSAFGDNYWVYFAKVGNDWIIVDIESEEMAAYGLYRETFDVAEAKKSFDLEYSTRHLYDVNIFDPDPSIDEVAATYSLPAGRMYDADNAIAYAYTYTTEFYNADRYGPYGNDPNFLNTSFTNHDTVNCQNFASQCIWAGFYGNDDSQCITDFDSPMDTVGDYKWYGSAGWRNDPTGAWIRVTKFKEYADASNLATNETGLRSVVDEIDSKAELMSKYSTQILGSILQVNYQNHSIVLTGTGTVNNNPTIFYCGNSVMRKNASIDEYTIVTNGDGNTWLIDPQSFVEVYNCNTHNYPVSSTSPDGYASKCSNCGYVLLHIYSDMFKPIAVGSTKTITGSTNLVCHNMAIRITTPSNVTTWYDQFVQTDIASISYTFNERRLYTIEIAARDVSQNETGVESTRVCHIFKLRVY